MLNKKIEIDLGGETYQLWFNNYAVFELQKMYGIEQTEVMKRVVERAEDNYLLLISDLVKAGIKGHSLAKGEIVPKINVQELVADANIEKLMNVLKVFYDIMGVNVEGDKKKAPRKKKK